MTRYIIILFFLLISSYSSAQKSCTIIGCVLDSITQNTLPGASIILTNQSDSLNKTGGITDNNGNFLIKAKPGDYIFSISFIGYKSMQKNIHLNIGVMQVGRLYLLENKKMLKEINIIKTLPPIKQIGDTSLFNPNAFKVNPDATAEELIDKMPGFYRLNGKLTAQGQIVKEVLVDGKKFFGKDVNQALETLPSDMIKKIKVYNYKSDNSRFSGFEDKTKSKTINIITKNKSNTIRFGEIAGGIGRNEKYATKVKLNQFSEKTRYTLTGQSKNINAPLHLSRSRIFRQSISGNHMQSNNLGLNFNTKSKNENELSAYYRYSANNIKSENSSLRTYTSYPLVGQNLSVKSINDNNKDNHNFNLDWDIKSNSKNQIMMNSGFSVSDFKTKNTSFSETKLLDQFINSNSNLASSKNSSTSFNQSFLFSRRLKKEGRIVSFQASYDRNDSKNDGNQKSTTKAQSKLGSQNIDQISSQKTNSDNLRTGISFNEKIGKNSRLSLAYNYALSKERTKKASYNYNNEAKNYSKLDTLTSNRFENSVTNNTSRISYNYQNDKIGFMLSNDFEFTHIKNDDLFPNKRNLKKDYFAILPSASFSYNINMNSMFNIYYNMETSNPGAQQLQEIVNVSSPLFLHMGNSNLKQTQNHNVMLFYSSSNMEKASFTSIHISINKTNKTIAKKTLVAQHDTLISRKYILPKGGQFSQPVNLNGQYNMSGRVSYGIPVIKLQSKLNINVSANYSQNPVLINNKKSFSNSLFLNQGLKLNSNISKKLDFTIANRIQYSTLKNTSLKSSNSKYISQTSSLSVYWNFIKNLIIKTNTNFVYKNNISTSDVENHCLLDMGISSKIFKNKRGEISLIAYDILNQKSERDHRISDLYTSDNYSNKMNKFYMFSFTYKIRNSNKVSRKPHHGMSMGNSYHMMN